MKQIILKAGREKSVRSRHPWIFSGAIETSEKYQLGEIVQVLATTREPLGYAYVNPNCDIRARMLTFSIEKDPYEAVRENIRKAIAMRKAFFGELHGKGIRLIHAEADLLPGLIVDLYDKVAVIQSSTAGIDALKDIIVEVLLKELQLGWIYEKSNSPSRLIERIPMIEKTLYGAPYSPVVIQENGIQHIVPVEKGQKSGFFIDQREMRSLVQRLSFGKRVLNCFSYTGGFSLSALNGGASHCTSVDCSEDALHILDQNIQTNALDSKKHSSVCADCFNFLRDDPLEYDLIILDPPAFVKKKSDLSQAEKGYRDINVQVMKKAKPGTLLLTASCSYYMDEMNFRKVLFQAARTSSRQVQILQSHIHAFDHPESLFVPETNYLKSFLLYLA